MDLLPILADAPANNERCQPRGNSGNHGGRGQNVLYVSGAVRYCTTRTVGMDRDDIYLNLDQRVNAGLNSRDTVLGAGATQPLQCP